ncbi:MAG: CDGSH iron-sulfur domain-containing protein [Coriobacteriia bacterium]|nr:CDGSH iron-sulfur domain-containing protein [Coriobacteriia bacterium]
MRKIEVTENGPYLVTGGVPLLCVEIVTNVAGESVAWREIARLDAGQTYSLCRCGSSAIKPFCDGSHLSNGFDGTERAGHGKFAQIAVNIDGPGVRLQDARKFCAEARFCDRAGGLWNLVKECDDPALRALVEEEAQLCPSGRYVVCDGHTHEAVEPELEISIALIEDPFLEVSGPLWVRGGIAFQAADGAAYEIRNRVTLCRCGSSANKPFCDGGHIGAKFRDR